MRLAARGAASEHLEHLLANEANPADPDETGDDGVTALIAGASAERDAPSVAKLLVDYGADCNLPDGRGMTPLMHAVITGNEDYALALMNRGADVNATDCDGFTALMEAAEHGRWSTLIHLVREAGADLEARDGTNATALHWAAAKGTKIAVKKLIELGANPLARDASGDTPLCAALRELNWDVARSMLNMGGVDVGADDPQALKWAAHNGGKRLVQKLLGRCAARTVDGTDAGGWTPLMWAAHEGMTEAALELIDGCGNVGSDVNFADREGQTALMWAALRGHAGTVAALIGAGASVNARDKGGRNALSRAKTLAVCKELVDAGIDMTVEPAGRGAPAWKEGKKARVLAYCKRAVGVAAASGAPPAKRPRRQA